MASLPVIVRHPVTRRGFMVAGLLFVSLTAGTSTGSADYPSAPQITKDGTAVVLQDYASLPLSSRTAGSYPPPINFAGQLGRANFLRSEPANAPQSALRFFVNDLNRNLYILDKATKTFTPYINFEEVFPRFDNDPGFAGGLVTFAFDPDYAANGKLYTIHTEDPAKSGAATPTNAALPGLDLSGGYATTAPVNPPAGTVLREAVLVEWTDTSVSDLVFAGTAREILRVGFNSNIHPMGDLLFNPLAQPGDADEGNLYIAVGDGGAGETAGATHPIPQRFDALPGKILRITPSLSLRPGDDLSSNGRYRIPTTGSDPNPFVSLSLPGLWKEIYAYGFRNPHRMSWDPVSNELIVNDIGLHSWEEVNLVTSGVNYGYAEREGTEQLLVGGADDGKTGSQTSPPTPFPDPDSLSVSGLAAPVTPVYPVASYSHQDGDAISSGFVYRGALIPQLYGRFLFGDITSARLFHADWADLLASDDGDRTSLAAVHELQVVFDDPHDNPDQGSLNRRLFDVVAEEYARRGGNAPGSSALPGRANVTDGSDQDGVPYGGGRADIRLALGGDGEIYVLSKSDGMIRTLVAVALPPPGELTATPGDAQVTLSWTASAGAASYNVKRSTTSGGPYTPIAAGVTTTGHTDTGLSNGTPYYYVVSAVNAASASVNSDQVSATPSGPNAAPTVMAAASASPNPVSGTTTTLSVLGADDGGEASLTYTWSTAGTPPAPVNISSNGTNAAKTTTATFGTSGAYTLQVTITDAGGLSTSSSVAVAVTLPMKDLVIEGLAVSAGSVAAGGSVTASYRVANRGTVTVAETYTDRLYLSTNSTLDAGDVLLGASHGHTADLGANATHGHTQAVTIPAGTAPGSQYILVQADALGAVPEGNEGNNVAAVAITVTASTKDLVIVGLAPSSGTVAAGGSLTISYSVKNQGSTTVTETYTDRLYLSTNPTLETATDTPLGQSHGHTADLATNVLHAHSQTVTIPATLPPGPYHLLVQADALGAVPEGNEANNVTAIPLTVTP